MPAGLKIVLESNKDDIDILIGVFFDLLPPILHVSEGMSIGDVIGKDDSIGAFVVRGCDGSKSLLSSSVPDLEFDGVLAGLDSHDFKIDANGGEKKVAESVFSEPEKETGFSGTGIATDDELKRIILLLHHDDEYFWLIN